MSQKMTKSQMKNENSAGGVVFYLDDEGLPRYLLIRDRFKKWTLPKGHVEECETIEMAAMREIFEETGLRVTEMVGELGSINFIFDISNEGKSDKITKKVDFFLFKINIADLVDIQPSPKEVTGTGWFGFKEAVDKTDYDNIKGIIENADKIIGQLQWN